LQRIEILSQELFESHREEIGIVDAFRNRFSVCLGWHYFLDLAWIVREIRSTLPRGALVLDAGAGSGILQLILAELGYNVISADFVGRGLTDYLERYRGVIHSLNNQSRTVGNRYTRHLCAEYSKDGLNMLSALGRLLEGFGGGRGSLRSLEKHRFSPQQAAPEPIFQGDPGRCCGRIFLYRCDLKEMPLLPDGLVDAVVSLSALEHNPHGNCQLCIDELLRVTGGGRKLVVTVSASQGEDWFHEPSKGWCYSEQTLKKLFRLPSEVPSNFLRREELFEKLKRDGGELQKRLDPFYFKSGANGMPWGKWDPAYQPVGVVKVKD